MRLVRPVLTALGVLFLVQGTAQLFRPEILTNLVDIHAGSVTGRTELQVVYGGLHIAFGAICLWGAAKRQNAHAAITVMLFVSLGVAIPRVCLGLLHQDFSAYSITAMLLEAASVFLILGLYRSSRLESGHPAPG